MTSDEFRHLPPTPENLERIGWESGAGRLSFFSPAPLEPDGLRLLYVPDSPVGRDWAVSPVHMPLLRIRIPALATIGDVLEWHRLLGIPVEEITA